VATHHTPKQVAEILQTSADRITDLIAAGELQAINIGRKGAKRATWRISAESLAAFLAKRSTSPAAPKVQRRKRKSDYVPTYY
jgi:excisionase family DNA binding protein